jgi:hypothetical protein
MLGFICGVLENAVKVYTGVKADIKGEEVRGGRERGRAIYLWKSKGSSLYL